MSAKDLYHQHCVNALERDGWTITADPLVLPYGKTELFVDIGAERLVAAERNGERIAVEVKSFVSLSAIQDLKEALGQFVLYADALTDSPYDSDRTLFLAIRVDTFNDVFGEDAPRKLIERGRVRLIVFDPVQMEIKQWIK